MAAIFKMAAVSGVDAMKSPRLLSYRSALDLELYVFNQPEACLWLQVVIKLTAATTTTTCDPLC